MIFDPDQLVCQTIYQTMTQMFKPPFTMDELKLVIDKNRAKVSKERNYNVEERLILSEEASLQVTQYGMI